MTAHHPQGPSPRTPLQADTMHNHPLGQERKHREDPARGCVLVLAPHTDDDTFGCGGTIAKHIAEGATVHIAAFSVCMQSVLKHLPADTLITEFHAACEVLGVPQRQRHMRDFHVRTFDRHRQEILTWMLELQRDLQPHRVYMPSLRDTHQDHHVIATEALRAFKGTTLLAYELPWNTPDFHAQHFQVLTTGQVKGKSEAVACYKSQAHRPYANHAFVVATATLRGVQCGAPHAEAFEVIRIVEGCSSALAGSGASNLRPEDARPLASTDLLDPGEIRVKKYPMNLEG